MTAHEASPDWPFDKLMCTCSCATRGRTEVERLKTAILQHRKAVLGHYAVVDEADAELYRALEPN